MKKKLFIISFIFLFVFISPFALGQTSKPTGKPAGGAVSGNPSQPAGSGAMSGAGGGPSASKDNAGGFDPFMKETLLWGQPTYLPWAKDADFLKAQQKNDCPALMAAYKTVLKDPLPGEEYNVHLAARYVCGTVLKPGDVFSQNGTAGPYSPERGFKEGPTYKGTNETITIGGGVCKIASTLFNTAILSNLEIVERHTHSMPVPYVPYGQDATVYYGHKDFKFKNDTEHPILIWSKGIDNILYIGFYSRTAPPKITWSHEVIDVYKAPVLSRVNRNLPKNTEKVVQEGMDGAVVTSKITILFPDGTTKVKDMGKSRYSALPFVKEISG